MDPRDQIDVRQTQLPLGIDLEVNDANTLTDPGSWTLAASGGVTKVADLTDAFPTRRYLRKPPKDTAFRGGLAAGARFGGAGWIVPPGAVASDESATEDSIQDTLPVQPPGASVPIRVRVEDAILIAAPTSATERRWSRHTVLLERSA